MSAPKAHPKTEIDEEKQVCPECDSELEAEAFVDELGQTYTCDCETVAGRQIYPIWPDDLGPESLIWRERPDASTWEVVGVIDGENDSIQEDEKLRHEARHLEIMKISEDGVVAVDEPGIEREGKLLRQSWEDLSRCDACGTLLSEKTSCGCLERQALIDSAIEHIESDESRESQVNLAGGKR